MATLDVYQVCFCGCGRKIKHCVPRAMHSELEKALRAVEGDQRMAALDHIRRIEAKHGKHSTLSHLKAQIFLELGQAKEAREAIEELAELVPDNPSCDCLLSLWESAFGDVDAAVEAVQRACADLDRVNPELLVNALAAVGYDLAQVQNLPAMRLHWLTMSQPALVDVLTDDHKRLVVQAATFAEMPARLSAADAFLPAPESLQDVFEEMDNLDINPAEILRWLERVEAREDVVRDPAMRHNLAVLNVRLHRIDRAVARWSELAADEQLEDWRRVEAGSWKSLYMEVDDEWIVETLAVQYGVPDIDTLNERLLDDPRFLTTNAPEESSGRRPRAQYGVLEFPPAPEDTDREEEGDSQETPVDFAKYPRVLGAVQLFGRQTDREATLRLQVAETELDAALTVLRDAAGDALGPELEREAIGGNTAYDLPAAQDHYVNVASLKKMERIHRALRRNTVVERWVRLPNPLLDGLTPAMAARDRQRRIQVESLLLLLRLQVEDGEDLAPVRARLGLSEPIGADESQWSKMPPISLLVHTAPSAMSDEQLRIALQSMGRGVPAEMMLSLLEEAAARKLAPNSEFYPYQSCHQLARLPAISARTRLAEVALTLAEQSRAYLESKGLGDEAAAEPDSPAEPDERASLDGTVAEALRDDLWQWELMRLQSLMLSNDKRADEALREYHLKNHQNPRAQYGLLRFFQSIGLVDERGQPVQRGPAAGAVGAGGPAESVGAAPAKGEIWTPDSGAGGDGDKKLWLPPS